MLIPICQINVADSVASTTETTVETLSILELITSGGVGGILIMLTLFILSIIAVYIFVERYITIKKAAQEDVNFMNEIQS